MYASVFDETMVTMNWQEIEEAGKKKLPVLFPIGVIEEHGPHISLGSDIFWSYAMCRMMKDKMESLGKECVIAPPYYWGVNHCTGGFPGSFSLKPETMKQVLFEIFENLNHFGFEEVYCFNYHGDAVHIQAIVKAIQEARLTWKMNCRLVLEGMDLEVHGWQGDEAFLLVTNPIYPMEWFTEQEASEQGLLDIHAGAFETAVMNYICPKQVTLEKACRLESSSLSREGMRKWLQGGEATREVVPLGYAGDPAGYETVSKHVEEMLDLQVTDIVSRICR